MPVDLPGFRCTGVLMVYFLLTLDNAVAGGLGTGVGSLYHLGPRVSCMKRPQQNASADKYVI
jgi:hypothetical protein